MSRFGVSAAAWVLLVPTEPFAFEGSRAVTASGRWGAASSGTGQCQGPGNAAGHEGDVAVTTGLEEQSDPKFSCGSARC